MQAVVDFISNTPKPEVFFGYKEWVNHPISFTGILIACISIILVGILVYYFRLKKNKPPNLTFTLLACALELATIQAIKSANAS
jgi:hypothetical protein